MEAMQQLAEAGFSSYLVGPSALERYFGRPQGRVVWIETEGSLVDLSRIFDGIAFPGAEYFDAALDSENRLYLFRCMDQENSCSQVHQATLQGSFRYNVGKNAFIDPCGAYGDLRSDTLLSLDQKKTDHVPRSPYAGVSPELRRWYIAAEIAMLVGGFDYSLPAVLRSPEGDEGWTEAAGEKAPGGTSRYPGGALPTGGSSPDSSLLTPMEQRFVLNGVLTGKNAAEGLQVLMDSGFVRAHWPLLAAMDEIFHSKEQHPEGNVWRHTLEAFLHRKVLEPELALGLLLHDVGKPFARENNGNRFDQHAQIGSHKARRFLERLGYPPGTVESVEYLVKYHMVPGALSKLPVYRTESVMSSPLFPDLLELYRCDVSSTFRGPEGYYRACRTYRAFLKHRHNPFRTSDGKKRLRLLVE